jgi:hypothetical protein
LPRSRNPRSGRSTATAQDTHFALREGDDDVAPAERLEDGLVDLTRRRCVVGYADQGFTPMFTDESTIGTYSPTRNGWVKMIVNPAATWLNTPCIERDPGSCDTDARDQRQQFHPEVLQRHDREQPHNKNPRDAHEQVADRDLKMELLQHPLRQPTCPAPDEKSRSQNEERDQHLRPEPYAEVDERVLDLRHGFELIIHPSSPRSDLYSISIALQRTPGGAEDSYVVALGSFPVMWKGSLAIDAPPCSYQSDVKRNMPPKYGPTA